MVVLQTTHLLLADGGEGTIQHSMAVEKGLPIISENWLISRTSLCSSCGYTSDTPKIFHDGRRMTTKTWNRVLLDDDDDDGDGVTKCDMWRQCMSVVPTCNVN